jgi:putative transcriptional regulator
MKLLEMRKQMNNYLKQKLEEKNMSQSELAKRCGVGKSHISQIIHKNVKPSLDLTYDISTILDISIEELIRSILDE